jgi:hypothetical protein
MRLLRTKRRTSIFIAIVVLVLVGGLYLAAAHPRPAKDAVMVQCQWLDSHDAVIPTSESSDLTAIARITDELSSGWFVIPLGKAKGIVVITLRDTRGNEQRWTLDVGNEVGEWGSSKQYYVGPKLERILRDTVPPPPRGDGHADTAPTGSSFTPQPLSPSADARPDG